jgi:hypothetical protein
MSKSGWIGWIESFKAVPAPRRPCLFCGATDLHQIELWIEGQFYDGVECGGCDIKTKLSFWNSRPKKAPESQLEGQDNE